MKLSINAIQSTKLLLITFLMFSGLLIINDYTAAAGKTLYEKSFQTKSGELLNVSISAGDIIVSSWDKNEVSITVIGDEDVNEYLEFFFEKTDEGITVRTEKKSTWTGWFKSLRYKVKAMVPSNYNTRLKTSGGDINLVDVNGELELATSGGDISVMDSKGTLKASTSGGDVNSVNFNGSSVLKTSGGDIDVLNSNGSTEVKTSGGDIKLVVSNGKVKGTTSGGDIELDYTGSNEGIALSTSGGDIEVKLPTNFSANLKLKTSGGKAKCNYSPVKVEEVSKSKFYGKLNNGGADVICKTSGGDIVVENK